LQLRRFLSGNALASPAAADIIMYGVVREYQSPTRVTIPFAPIASLGTLQRTGNAADVLLVGFS